MANYYISRYQTGLQDSVAEATALLEAKIEDLDASTNTIHGSGILLTRRDQEQAIGWVLYDGYDINGADHLHYADSLVITTT